MSKTHCPDCQQPWDDHEFGVPAPYCPIVVKTPALTSLEKLDKIQEGIEALVKERDELRQQLEKLRKEGDSLRKRLADAIAQVSTIRESKFASNPSTHNESRALKWMNRALNAEIKLNKVRLAYENGGGFGLIEAIKAL